MIRHKFISFSAVQIYDLSYIHLHSFTFGRRSEYFTGIHITDKNSYAYETTIEWRIFHILNDENIDDVIYKLPLFHCCLGSAFQSDNNNIAPWLADMNVIARVITIFCFLAAFVRQILFLPAENKIQSLAPPNSIRSTLGP